MVLFPLTVGLRSRPEDRGGFDGDGASLKELLSEELERVMVGSGGVFCNRLLCRESAKAEKVRIHGVSKVTGETASSSRDLANLSLTPHHPGS